MFRSPAASLLAALVLGLEARADVAVTALADRVRIEIDGALFTECHFGDAAHVYYWPLMGPGGVAMTRAWPMAEVPGEERDHPHHRSLWFSHGLVNGIDFWAEAASFGGKESKLPLGKIVHDRVVTVQSGKEGVLATAQRWVAPDGSVPLTSVQTLRVYSLGADVTRAFDFTITLQAGEKEVVFGDTKEGTFALRIAESMRLLGANKTAGQGRILNSEGLRDGAVWGQRAKWVCMSGPIDGKPMSIAVFDHLHNLRFPTRWHARDYGLFAANPFCEHEMDKGQVAGAGDYRLGAHESLTFHYRVVLLLGEAKAEMLDFLYSAFPAVR